MGLKLVGIDKIDSTRRITLGQVSSGSFVHYRYFVKKGSQISSCDERLCTGSFPPLQPDQSYFVARAACMAERMSEKKTKIRKCRSILHCRKMAYM